MSAPRDTLNEQDPDYVSSVPNNEVQQKVFEQNARANTSRKIREIFDKEFSKEIDAKGKEVLEIQERLQKSLKTLQLLRYVIVTDYYTRKQCQLPEVQTESKQTRIHPAIKQLIGKCPREIETNFINVSSTSKQSTDCESEKPSSSKDQISITKSGADNEEFHKNERKRNCEGESGIKEPPKKVPRYIPPKSSSPESAVPSRGLHNKVRRRVIIGNISKWIPPDWRDDAASHKWTVYVRSSKDEVEISEFVSKVRFFLHPTYKPHDVVEITSSPFHLTRRGWGEFPVRVQLHFKNSLNKPTDVIHHLKLDQTYTGLQTLGSETVVDIWLQSKSCNSSNQTSETKDQTKQKEDALAECADKAESTANECFKSPSKYNTELQNKTCNESIKELKLCIRNEHDYALMDYVVGNNRTIVHPPSANSERKRYDLPSMKKSFDLQTDNNVPQTNGSERLTEEELAVVVSNAIRPSKNAQSVTNMARDFKNLPGKMQPLNIKIPFNFETKKKQLLLIKNNKLMPINSANVSKNCVNKNSENSLVEHNLSNKIEQVKAKNNSKTILLSSSNSFVLNTNSNEPALQIAEKYNEHIQKNGSNVGSNGDHEINIGNSEQSKQKVTKKDAWEEEMRSINNYKFTDTIGLIKFIMNRLPLITPEATDAEYRRLHPYACASLNEYLRYNIGKQKYLEWYRAKIARSFMKKLVTSDEELWTMKEIIIWARHHGYTPIISNLNTKKSSMKSTAKEPTSVNQVSSTRTVLPELEEWFLKCQNENDSQSDVEIDVENEITETSDFKKLSRIKHTKESKVVNENSEVLKIPTELEPLYSFVSEVTRECGGIKLENETIFPGIRHCSAARVMMKAVQCLVSDIIRSAHAQTLEKCSNNDSHNRNPVITESDIKAALSSREEFDIFTNIGLGTKQKTVESNSE